MTYDGSVNIDTRLDTKGFNKGTKSISASLSGVMKSVAMVGKAMAAAFIGGSIINGIRSIIGSFDLMNSSIGGSLKTLSTSFAGLKSSFASLVLTAFAPMIPYVIAAVDWLTKLFTTLAQVTAALFGTGVAMANVKDETKDAGKEAKKAAGALAGFDQINVLDVNKGVDNTSVSQAAQMVPVTDDILSKVQEIKDTIASWWNDRAGMVKEIWGSIIEWLKTQFSELMDNIFPDGSAFIEKVINPLSVGFFVFVESTKELFSGLWETILNDSMSFTEKIEKIFGLINDWLVSNFKPGIDNIINNLFPENAAGESLKKNVLDPLSVGFYTFIESTKKLMKELWATLFDDSLSLPEKVKEIFNSLVEWFNTNFGNSIKEIFNSLVEWFNTNFGNSIKEIFNNTLDGIKEKFTTIFEDVKSFVKDIINDIIGMINGMIGSIASGINDIVAGFNIVGNLVPGFTPLETVAAPRIPRLATGAVIPPNAQFAAILGDNKSQKEILAPEDTLRRIFAEVLQGAGGGNQNINITFSGSMSELVRVLKPHIDKENSRVGASLIRGSVGT